MNWQHLKQKAHKLSKKQQPCSIKRGSKIKNTFCLLTVLLSSCHLVSFSFITDEKSQLTLMCSVTSLTLIRCSIKTIELQSSGENALVHLDDISYSHTSCLQTARGMFVLQPWSVWTIPQQLCCVMYRNVFIYFNREEIQLCCDFWSSASTKRPEVLSARKRK